MKFLSFRFEGALLYGVKVKKEEAAWNIVRIHKELLPNESVPATLLEGIQNGMELQETVRKCISAAVESDQVSRYKVKFMDLVWEAPIPRTPKNVMCIGKNYQDHVLEMGSEKDLPKDIVVFTKASTTITGDHAPIPPHEELTKELDYEGELAVVIGKKGKNIPEQQAIDYVFGYTILNDITARDLQAKHKQFFLGKSLDETCPMGPYLVSKDEIPYPNELSIVTKVNDEIRQNGNTQDMIFSIEEIISTLSKGMTLEPGDVIATGTPAGVGKGLNPPIFLKKGDQVKVSIQGIGTLNNGIGE
ncbi:fumarylacetoacetate hydrolase family protein [Jeotgalibacillus marinus]|uniref:Fumarylacetoacetate hydrolase family protein n=1 Tax=Jeotgalibacillus marinus TaxID=86667 RepID=A0ABV3Q3F3_9BACL